MSFKESVSQHVPLESLFAILDNDNDGRIDGMELLAGLTLCCQAEFEDKARFCFELFDFNLNASLSKKEMIVMMISAICGMNLLLGGDEEEEPELKTFEKLATDAFLRADKDKSGAISFDEFVIWARSNREMMSTIENLTKLAEEAKREVDTEDSAENTSEGEMSDAENPDCCPQTSCLGEGPGTGPNAKAKVFPSAFSDESLGDDLESEDVSFKAIVQWKTQIFEPSNHCPSKRSNDGPDTNLELQWVHGVRAQTSRGNVRYVQDEARPDRLDLIVYPVARLGVVFEISTRRQRFYQGHCAEVTCLALNPSGRIVATADKSSMIHIWDALTLECLDTFRGIVKQGIQHIAFAPNGESLVTVGLDLDHTVCIHETSSGELISSAKGLVSPNNVLGLAYSLAGTEICVVGKKQVIFYKNVMGRRQALQGQLGKIGKQGRKQTFFCVAYFNEDAVVGCASGELYRFRSGRCVQIVQAHGVNDPVLSMYFNAMESVLVTGGKDGTVKTWTSNLKEVGNALDLSEDLDGDGKADNGSLNNAVISVQIFGNNILVGTKGSDIFEAIMPATPNDILSLNQLAWGHSSGEVWGLATHPSRDEYATCGDDETLRIWSIRTNEQIHLRLLPQASRTVAYNNAGNLLSLGMVDGGMAVIDSSNLRVVSAWTHSSQSINDVKFSPSGYYLIGASADGNIYIYKSDDAVHFFRQAVCRGHKAPVLHVDFSADGQHLQSNAQDCSILYWDMRGNVIKSASILRDTPWGTWTCTLGWPVQGIYPAKSRITDINTCHAVPESGVLVTGNDSGALNLFRYPSLDAGAIYQTYSGHSGHVQNVRFTHNRRYVVSVGGRDRAVLLWKHEPEEDGSSSDEEADEDEQMMDGARAGSSRASLDYKYEVADVGDRTALQEAVNRQRSTQELIDLVREGGLDEGNVSPWKANIVEPTDWLSRYMKKNRYQTVEGSTDVDLELDWIHGYRSFDCRNNLRYNGAGNIVFHAAAIGVVFNKSTGKQGFLHGAHADDILGLTAHPAGQLFASGEAGKTSTIIVWDAERLHIRARLSGVHQHGVSLLAFNSRGNYLASVGLDRENTLVVYEWKKKNMILSTPTDKRRILCVSFVVMCDKDSTDTSAEAAPNYMVVTGGVSHMKFWWARGQNVKSQRALWGHEKVQDVMCISSLSPGKCLVGTVSGDLFVWNGFKLWEKADRTVNPHVLAKSPVQAMWCSHEDLEDLMSFTCITGDKVGNVAIWRFVETDLLDRPSGVILKCIHSFNVSTLQPTPTDVSVRSVCEWEGVMLIGTQGSEVYEVPYGIYIDDRKNDVNAEVICNESKLHISGHSKGELWGLCCHQTKPLFFTAGDDGTLRSWRLPSHEKIAMRTMEAKARSLAINFKGTHLAVGLNTGKIKILRVTSSGEFSSDEVCTLTDPRRLIKTLQFSRDDCWLAAGSHDTNIYLYQITPGTSDAEDIFQKCKVLSGHSKFITHLDFGTLDSADSSSSELFLQSNCDAGELRFWAVKTGSLVEYAAEVRDVAWETFSCTLGWPVQGIRPSQYDGSSINAVARSRHWETVPVTASVDGFGRVRLYNYPSLTPGAPDKCYRGHSGHVTNVDFSHSDAFCITTGGDDKCVFVWATDIVEEIRERTALEINQKAYSNREKHVEELEFVEEYDEKFSAVVVQKEERRTRGGNLDSKPWKGAVREPTKWEEPKGFGKACQQSLELKYVYGYRGWDCRNNVGFASNAASVVYHVAGVGIVLNTDKNTQIHNTDHTDDILCLDVHPDGHTIATGEIGKKPKLILWDASTGNTLRTIMFHHEGIACVSFTGDGSHVVSVGMDIDIVVAVHNCHTGHATGSGKIGQGVDVYVLSVCGTSIFVTGGKNHVKFWDISTNTEGRVELSSKGGLFSKSAKSTSVISAAYLGQDAVTGMTDGTILKWKGRTNVKIVMAHSAAVTAMCSLPHTSGGANTGFGDSGSRVITGGKDGYVFIWNSQLKKVWSFNLAESIPASFGPQIQAVSFREGNHICYMPQ